MDAPADHVDQVDLRVPASPADAAPRLVARATVSSLVSRAGVDGAGLEASRAWVEDALTRLSAGPGDAVEIHARISDRAVVLTAQCGPLEAPPHELRRSRA